jgi:hypothetical protein
MIEPGIASASSAARLAPVPGKTIPTGP